MKFLPDPATDELRIMTRTALGTLAPMVDGVTGKPLCLEQLMQAEQTRRHGMALAQRIQHAAAALEYPE